MMRFISKVWKMLGKKVQWLVIWIMHAKFNVGVSVIIPNTNGDILLAEHVFSGEKPWRLIGGYVNMGEHMYAGAKREAKEELGIDIEIDRLLRVRTGFAYRVELTVVAKPVDTMSASFKEKLKVDKKELKQIGWFRPGQEPAGTLESHIHLLKLYSDQKEGGKEGHVEVENLE